jgi:hypothetical protein
MLTHHASCGLTVHDDDMMQTYIYIYACLHGYFSYMYMDDEPHSFCMSMHVHVCVAIHALAEHQCHRPRASQRRTQKHQQE